jgi:hypothetical protein
VEAPNPAAEVQAIRLPQPALFAYSAQVARESPSVGSCAAVMCDNVADKRSQTDGAARAGCVERLAALPLQIRLLP